MENKYLGYQDQILTDEQFTQLYSEGRIDAYEFKENEYLIARNIDNEVVDHLQMKNGRLERIPFQVLNNHYLGQVCCYYQR